MAKPTVTVTLNHNDLHFLSDCIGLNIPSEEDRQPEERKTARKIYRAQDRLADKSIST